MFQFILFVGNGDAVALNLFPLSLAKKTSLFCMNSLYGEGSRAISLINGLCISVGAAILPGVIIFFYTYYRKNYDRISVYKYAKI